MKIFFISWKVSEEILKHPEYKWDNEIRVSILIDSIPTDFDFFVRNSSLLSSANKGGVFQIARKYLATVEIWNQNKIEFKS